MAKTKALVKKSHDPVEAFLGAQCEVEERALPTFQAALKRAAERALQEALAEAASMAFGDGVEWANNTKMTPRERKLIA